MSARNERWLTAQETAALMNTTSAEVCRLLSIGRLVWLEAKASQAPGQSSMARSIPSPSPRKNAALPGVP